MFFGYRTNQTRLLWLTIRRIYKQPDGAGQTGTDKFLHSMTEPPVKLHQMKFQLVLCFLFCAINLQAQNYQLRLGYGSENNWGNTAFVFGGGYEKWYSDKFSASISADYFTTGIYNVYKAHPTGFKDEDRYYKALFFSLEPSFCIIGRRNKFNVSLSAGPTIFYRSYKVLSQFSSRLLPDGTVQINPQSIKYNTVKGLRLAYNASLDISVPFKTFELSAGVRTYASNEIPLEFLTPSLTFTKAIK
jgi:hypothetical protein